MDSFDLNEFFTATSEFDVRKYFSSVYIHTEDSLYHESCTILVFRMAIKQDAAFDAFVSTSQAMLGSDLSRDWLFEIWVGADADPNRALNHVLDSPEDKVRRTSGGNKSSSESKPAKKSKPPKESKPAPTTPATTWGDDDWSPPPAPAPVPQHAPAPAPVPQQAPQQQMAPQQIQPVQYPQQSMMPGGYMMQPNQTMMQPQPMMMPQSQPMMNQGMMMPQSQAMMGQPMMGQPMMQPQTMMFDPMTGMPIAPMNAIQQAQTMFVQQQQQQRLMALKASIDSVLSNPGMMMNPQIMQNLQDTMIMALEAPNATLQLAERARQSQQTAQFIQIMQGQVAQMLADPKVATNPALLQQLNTQMNQLRMLTMQHVAQQQIDSNPASVLSLSMPVIAPPSASAAMLSRAMLSNSQNRLDDPYGGMVAQGLPVSNRELGDANDDWWNTTPKANKTGKLSEKNPFRDDTESTVTTPFSSSRKLRASMPSLAGVPVMGMGGGYNGLGMGGYAPMSMPALGMGMGGMAPTPLSLMYGSQQAGYNPLLALQVPQQSPYGMPGSGFMGYPQAPFSRMI